MAHSHFDLMNLQLSYMIEHYFVFIVSDKKSRYWNAGGNALNVETAGYALLTQIILGRTDYARPIVTYLTSQRKGGVGFVSTQVCN